MCLYDTIKSFTTIGISCYIQQHLISVLCRKRHYGMKIKYCSSEGRSKSLVRILLATVHFLDFYSSEHRDRRKTLISSQ